MLTWDVPLFAQDFLQVPPLALEHYHQGVFYGKNGKYVEAIMELEKAIEVYPGYADAHNALGVVYHRQHQQQDAIKYYLLAIEAMPQHVKARTNLALVYKEQEAYEDALEQLKRALEIDPSYTDAKKLLPEVQRLLEEQKAAEAQKRPQEKLPVEAITVSSVPPSTSASRQASKPTATPSRSTFEQGMASIRKGNIDAGIEKYEKALTQLPCSAEGLTLLGMAYREKFRIAQQLVWQEKEVLAFQKAIQCDPDYVPAILGLAETFYAQKDYVNADRYFRYVLLFQPDHPAREQIEALLRR